MKVKIQPRKQSDRGGYIMMPMRINVNDPVDKSWKLVRCPELVDVPWREEEER